MLENDINFSRDESGNYVALVKVLNPAFYGGADANLNQNAQVNKEDQGKKGSKSNINEQKKDETKLRGEKGKSGQNASKSMPKNISEKYAGDNKGYKSDLGNNSQLSYKENSISSKKKGSHKYSEKFEKEKKSVSYKQIIPIL